MQLNEAVKLIQSDNYAPVKSAKWADLGCGTGLFTQALASLLPTGSTIYAVDTNQSSLAGLTDYKDIDIEPIHRDFVQDDWPFNALDGILMANSLHYVADKPAFLEKAGYHLNESGCFLIVEYDTDIPNPWVPYPLSYDALRQLFKKAGYKTLRKIQERPSIYGSANLYSAYVNRD